jgi:uncharacterized RDD family membrane protein YckC
MNLVGMSYSKSFNTISYFIIAYTYYETIFQGQKNISLAPKILGIKVVSFLFPVAIFINAENSVYGRKNNIQNIGYLFYF